MGGGVPTLLPRPPGECGAPGRAAGVGGRGGGLHDEFSSELRELGSWALLGELGVCGGRCWYPGSDRGLPGEGTPREEPSGERGEGQLWFWGRGGSEAAAGCQGRDAEGRKPRRGKQGLQERLPHRAARRRDAHRAWCHVWTARPPRLEPRPAWKLCLAQLKLLNSYRDGEPKTFSHQPTSFLGCPLPRPEPLPLALGLRFVILPRFWHQCTAPAAGPACAASVHVSLLPRDQVRGPGCCRGFPDVLEAHPPPPPAGIFSAP